MFSATLTSSNPDIITVSFFVPTKLITKNEIPLCNQLVQLFKLAREKFNTNVTCTFDRNNLDKITLLILDTENNDFNDDEDIKRKARLLSFLTQCNLSFEKKDLGYPRFISVFFTLTQDQLEQINAALEKMEKYTVENEPSPKSLRASG